MADAYLLETGVDRILLEDGSGVLLLEPGPVLVAYSESSWNVGTAKATASFTWLTGDVFVAVGIAADNPLSLTTPATTGSGLTFAALTGSPTNTGSTCKGYAWSATASAGSSGTVTSTAAGGATANNSGIAVWQYRRSDGVGAAVLDTTAAKTASLTRAADDSAVVTGVGDWSAGAVAGYSFTPAGATDREAAAYTTNYAVYVADWPGQGVAGATSYGVSGTASSGAHTNVAVEVKGPAVAGGQFAVGVAAETDAAQAVTAVPGEVAGAAVTAAETDAAQPVAAAVGAVTLTAAPAVETAAAQTVVAAPGEAALTAAVSTETDAAQPVTPALTYTAAADPAVETDAAQPVTLPGASAVYREGFEGGVDAAAITSANTVFNQPYGSMEFDTGVAGVPHGTVAGLLPTATASGFRHDHTAETAQYLRCYARIAAAPSANTEIFAGWTGPNTTSRWDVRITTGMLVQFRIGQVAAGTSSWTVPTDAWFRLELKVDATAAGGSHVMEARLFTGANINGVTPDQTHTITNGSIAGSWSSTRTGRLNGAQTAVWYFDEVAADTAGWVGPAGATAAAGTAAETDTAEPVAVSGVFTAAVGAAAEADAAQPVTDASGAGQTVGVAAEADAAQPFGVELGATPAVEADAAQALTAAATFAAVAGIAAETDAAQPATASSSFTATLGVAGEADTAVALGQTGSQTVTADPAAETDAAQPLTAALTFTAAAAVAAETDTAEPVTVVAAATAGVAVEADAAQPVTAALTFAAAVDAATETDTAVGVGQTGSQTILIGAAAEADAAPAVAVTGELAAPVSVAAEADAAQLVGALQVTVVAVAVAAESDAAVAFTWVGGPQFIAAGIAAESDAAQPVRMRLLVGRPPGGHVSRPGSVKVPRPPGTFVGRPAGVKVPRPASTLVPRPGA